ncbi:hypothetical protein J3F83DRAFT_230825 [Trichoderma novae-zelandiae]
MCRTRTPEGRNPRSQLPAKVALLKRSRLVHVRSHPQPPLLSARPRFPSSSPTAAAAKPGFPRPISPFRLDPRGCGRVDSSSSGSHQLRPGSETPTAAATARRPPALLTRDSSLSNTTSSSSSSAGYWSRVSTTSTDQSFPSRTASDAARPPTPNRDSFVSIVDDPFFQNLDTPTAVAPDPYKHLEFESETLAEIPLFSPEPSRGNRYYVEEGHQEQHWPPPRRESLTIGSTPVWVCYARRLENCRLGDGRKDEEEMKAKISISTRPIQSWDQDAASTQLERHGLHEFDAALHTDRQANPILTHAPRL